MSIPFNGQNSQMSPQEQETIKMMHAAMESCVVKTAMSGAAGKVILPHS
jgi:import inner membrane translocase subunit TIM22